MFQQLFSRRGRTTFNIEPHVGILPLKLEMPRNEVQRLMRNLGYGLSSSHDQSDYYIESSVQVEFDAAEKASFIGISPHHETDVLYNGKRVFEHEAEFVFSFIRECGDEMYSEYEPREYLFRKQILTLWDAAEQYELGGERFPVWGQIGVGNQYYLSAVDAINGLGN